MASEFSAARIQAALARQVARAIATQAAATMKIALAVERQAKLNASNGAHVYGTPTPARPGEGPAVIYGDLRRSITHNGDPMTKMRVGPADVPHRDSKATCGEIGYYLELGKGRYGSIGPYPFLGPAYKKVTGQTPKLWHDTWSGA